MVLSCLIIRERLHVFVGFGDNTGNLLRVGKGSLHIANQPRIGGLIFGATEGQWRIFDEVTEPHTGNGISLLNYSRVNVWHQVDGRDRSTAFGIHIRYVILLCFYREW